MPLDHTATASQIERNIEQLEAHLIEPKTIGQHRLWNEIKKDLLGLADWHNERAENQRRQENIFLISELHKSAQKQLTKSN